MELPGQSLFDLHVTTVIQRTLGSGSGIEPSGQIHSNDPARLRHKAPLPQRFGLEHSSISEMFQFEEKKKINIFFREKSNEDTI